MRKCHPYSKHLHSIHFQMQRNIAWVISIRRCNICFARFDLQPHHLGYLFADTIFEWMSLRFVCSRCHKRVQHFLFFRMTKTLPLVINYYVWKIGYWGTIGLIRVMFALLKWFFISYTLPKQRKRSKYRSRANR